MSKQIPRVIGECKGCGYCLIACPVGAAGPINPQKVDVEKCTGCGKCVSVCPQKAREMVEWEEEPSAR